MQFSTLLKTHRLEEGLSFQQLSDRSNVDVAYLHRLESGAATNPGRNVVIRIAIGLGLGLYKTEELLLASGHLTLVAGVLGGHQRRSQTS